MELSSVTNCGFLVYIFDADCGSLTTLRLCEMVFAPSAKVVSVTFPVTPRVYWKLLISLALGS